jgi:hypothetical protein
MLLKSFCVRQDCLEPGKRGRSRNKQMKKRFFLWRVRSFVLGVTLLFASNIFSQTIFHVRSGASGNGSDWNNALGALPATLVRGATYYVADGSYPGYTFDDAESGTSVITVKKAIEADHGTSVGWNSTYGDGQAVFNGGFIMVRDYYVIDGQVRNEVNWKDDASYGFRIKSVYGQNSSFPPGGDNITVRCASLGGNYSESYYAGMEEAVYCGGFAGNFHHWTISKCFLHNSVHTIVQFAGVNDMLVEYCFIGPGWGKEAIRGQISAYNVTVRHNTFYNSTQIDPGDGTSGITAEIGVWSGNHDNWQVYGNTFSNSKFGGRNGVIVIGGNGTSWPGPPATGVKVYNNTFAGIADSSAFGSIILNGSGNDAINNLFFDCADSRISASRTSNNLTVTANPFLNYSGQDFRLTATSPARNTGINVGGAPYNVDRLGSVRGGDGTWDVGAFEFASGLPDTTPPTITGVSATALTSTSATIVWTTDEASNSRVEYGTTTAYGGVASNPSIATAHSVSLTGLSPGTTYQYRVSSSDSAGNTRISANFTFNTAAADTTAPVISGVNATGVTARQATIGWVTDEVASSSVEYGTTTTYGSTTNRTALVTTHGITIANLTPSTLYHYRVRAVDATGNARTSSDFTFTTPAGDTTRPSIAITSPSAGAVLTGQATLAASASDSGSGILDVRFYVNGSLMGTASSSGGSTYTLSWNTTAAANGSHVLTAVARDRENNETTSSQVTVSIQNTGPDLRTGLIGHWALDQADGATVMDSSVSANHGSFQNGAAYVTGQNREGLSFDGVDDYVRIPNGTNIDRSFPITLAVWIKPEANGGWQSLLSKIVSDGTHSNPYSAYDLTLVGEAGNFRPWIAVTAVGGNREYSTSSASFAFGTWYHIAGTYDGATLRTYVNGSEVASTPFTGTIAKYNQPLFLGANGGGGDRYKGIMDDVRIYSRALSGTEIQTLYNAKTPQSPAGVQIQK